MYLCGNMHKRKETDQDGFYCQGKKAWEVMSFKISQGVIKGV